MFKQLLSLAALSCASLASAQAPQSETLSDPIPDVELAVEALSLLSEYCGPDRLVDAVHDALTFAGFERNAMPIPQRDGSQIESIEKYNEVVDSFRVYTSEASDHIFVIFADKDDKDLIDKCIIDSQSISPIELAKSLVNESGPPKRGEKVGYVWPNWEGTGKTLLLIKSTVENHKFREKALALALTSADSPDAQIAMEHD